MPTTRQVLECLEAGLRSSGAQDRNTITTEAFQIFISTRTESYHMSFAVPHGPEPKEWTSAIEVLCQTFAQQTRRPRLEFFQELHPSLAAALEVAGFKQDMAAPVMSLTASELAGPPAESKGTYLRLKHEDAAELELFLRRQSLAYGGTGDDGALDWLPSLRQGLRGGTAMVAGLDLDGGLVAGATMQIGGDVGELAGVWTLPKRQRQGLAYALCQRFLADYFDAGYDLCWLSAAEGALRLYEKLGFRRVGMQLNMGLDRPMPT